MLLVASIHMLAALTHVHHHLFQPARPPSVAARSCSLLLSAAMDLSSLTPADVRGTASGDALIVDLEAAAIKAIEASNGSPDVRLSQLLAVAHSSAGDYDLAAPHAQTALAAEGAAEQAAELRAEMFFVIGL